jgi:hypothetical protein
MKKIKTLTAVTFTVGVAWVVGALGYFLLVSHHFSTIERKEDADKNRTIGTSSNSRGGKRDAATPDWGNENLGTYLREAVSKQFGPKAIQRTATGNYEGNRIW